MDNSIIDGAIKSTLNSTLLRILELEPKLGIESAIDRILRLIPSETLLIEDRNKVECNLKFFASTLKLRWILNPHYISQINRTTLHFYLINSRPGWLKHMVQLAKEFGEGISYYTIYRASVFPYVC